MHTAVGAVHKRTVLVVYWLNARQFAAGSSGVLLVIFCGGLLGFFRGDGSAAFHAELVSPYQLFTAIFAKHYIHILSDGLYFYIEI